MVLLMKVWGDDGKLPQGMNGRKEGKVGKRRKKEKRIRIKRRQQTGALKEDGEARGVKERRQRTAVF